MLQEMLLYEIIYARVQHLFFNTQILYNYTNRDNVPQQDNYRFSIYIMYSSRFSRTMTARFVTTHLSRMLIDCCHSFTAQSIHNINTLIDTCDSCKKKHTQKLPVNCFTHNIVDSTYNR